MYHKHHVSLISGIIAAKAFLMLGTQSIKMTAATPIIHAQQSCSKNIQLSPLPPVQTIHILTRLFARDGKSNKVQQRQAILIRQVSCNKTYHISKSLYASLLLASTQNTSFKHPLPSCLINWLLRCIYMKI